MTPDKARMLLAAAVAASLVLVVVPRGEAHHKPKVECEGNPYHVCRNVFQVEGIRYLTIRTYPKVFTRYRLCVTAPDDTKNCSRFRIRKTSTGGRESKVKWRKHFPFKGSGAYTVSWRVKGKQIGHKLGFHYR